MITFVLMNSWTCFKFQDQSPKEKGHTFKSHICARWELVTLERLYELVFQGGISDYPILFVLFVPVIHLRDEVVEFCKDRHDRNCLWSVAINSLEIPNGLTVPAKVLIEEHPFQSQ
jgi:hypothetical protein